MLVDGELAAHLERGGHSLVTFGVEGWAPALRDLVDGGRYRSLEIRKVDGVPVRDESVHAIADDCGLPDSSRAIEDSCTGAADSAGR